MTTDKNITDAERAFRTKDYELKISYLTGQFTRMWQRFQFFVVIQAAFVGGKTVFEDNKATVPLAIAGILVSAAWFIIGAEDRYLVHVYRHQAHAAGHELSKCVPRGADETESYEPAGSLNISNDLKRELDGRKVWERFTEWRCEPISITHLPCWLSLLSLVGWVSVLLTQIKSS